MKGSDLSFTGNEPRYLVPDGGGEYYLDADSGTYQLVPEAPAVVSAAPIAAPAPTAASLHTGDIPIPALKGGDSRKVRAYMEKLGVTEMFRTDAATAAKYGFVSAGRFSNGQFTISPGTDGSQWQIPNGTSRFFVSDDQVVRIEYYNFVITNAYIENWPDSGINKFLGQAWVTQLLFLVVGAAFTGGYGVESALASEGSAVATTTYTVGETAFTVSNQSIGSAIYSGEKALASGDTTGGLVAVAKFAGGVDVGDYDYANAFEGFDYSSGEADFAFSDAQVVDFGFNGNGTFEMPDDVVGFGDGTGTEYGANGYEDAVGSGVTPEVTTNDFGTSFDSGFGTPPISTAVSAVKLATAPKPSQKAQTGVASGGKAAKIAAGSNDVIATFANVLQSVGSTAASLSMTATQKTPVRTMGVHAGQLAPAGSARPLSSGAILAIAAVAVIGGFLILKGAK